MNTKRRDDREEAQGFTLIELLVVIAVIAILAALLLPALSKSKNQSYQIKCISNQKQMSLAAYMYMDDAGGNILESDTNNLDSWVGRLRSYGVTTNLILCPTTQLNTQSAQNENLGGSASMSWCAWPLSNPINGSYALNGWFFSYSPNAAAANSTWVPPPPSLVTSNPQFIYTKLSAALQPAQTPIFSDADFWNEWPVERDQPSPDLSQGEWENIIGMQRCCIWRHGGKTATSPVKVTISIFHPTVLPQPAAINIGFADGHVQMVKLNNLWTLNWHKNWTPASNPPN